MRGAGAFIAVNPLNRFSNGSPSPIRVAVRFFWGEISETTLRERLLGGGTLVLPHSGGCAVLGQHLVLHR